MTEHKSQNKKQELLADVVIHELMIENLPILKGEETNPDEYKDYGDLISPRKVSVLHAIIYDWVMDVYGENEAYNPSWDIADLVQHIRHNLWPCYEQRHCVTYSKENHNAKSKVEMEDLDEDEE